MYIIDFENRFIYLIPDRISIIFFSAWLLYATVYETTI